MLFEPTADDMKRPPSWQTENQAARSSRVIGIVFDDRPIANRLFDISSTDLAFAQLLGVGCVG